MILCLLFAFFSKKSLCENREKAVTVGICNLHKTVVTEISVQKLNLYLLKENKKEITLKNILIHIIIFHFLYTKILHLKYKHFQYS